MLAVLGYLTAHHVGDGGILLFTALRKNISCSSFKIQQQGCKNTNMENLKVHIAENAGYMHVVTSNKLRAHVSMNKMENSIKTVSNLIDQFKKTCSVSCCSLKIQTT